MTPEYKMVIGYLWGVFTLTIISASFMYYSGEATYNLQGQIIEMQTDLNYFRSVMDRDYTKTTNASGKYYPPSQNIALFTRGVPPHSVLRTAHHEIGHYIWFEWIGDKERVQYYDIFNRTDTYVSPYARTNALEDFAETIQEGMVCKLDVDKIPGDRKEIMMEVKKRLWS